MNGVTKVVNMSGAIVDYEAACMLMDEETLFETSEELAPCTEQEFFTEYERRHLAKFGKWELSKANPVY